ncbi:MAG TPA: MBG domain-containing protein, partial [Candidatus Dormibacteraeota bacterium]|nr:MBG domain-containing protein [Candidatus Dormibacteraeota bacterium]
MQPLIGHGGWAPSTYAYGIFRNAIEWAFGNARKPVPRLSAWPYAYDAAFNVRHDFENYQNMISNIESSARYEFTNGVKGDYYFCSGTLRVELTNSPAVVASLRRAATNYGATIAPHNGGLKNANNPNLLVSDFDYWHWGPDEALDTAPAGYANGKAYALASVSNAFNDVEGWLAGITNGVRLWVAPYFNATRENSYDIEQQLGVKIAGEQKLTPFPHWTLSTQTAGKRYAFLSLPVSDWFVSSEIGQSIEEGHNSATVHALIDYYYNLGALINLYSHSGSDGSGTSGNLVQDYIQYGRTKPRLWMTNAVGVYSWWTRRSGTAVIPSFTTRSNQSSATFNVVGIPDAQSAVEVKVPVASYSGLQVFTNGVAASGDAFRTNGQLVRVLLGTSVSSAEIRYLLFPTAVADSYNLVAGSTLNVGAPGVLANDVRGLGTNLTAVLVTAPAHGNLTLNVDGSFSYVAATNFSGIESFSYKANDGTADSSNVVVTLVVTPVPNVLFADDFTRGSDPGPLAPWSVQSGNWTVTGGMLKGGTNANFTYGFAYLGNTWSNYSAEARIQFPVGAFGGGLGGCLNPANGSHYAAWIYPEGSLGSSPVVRLLKFQNWATYGYNGSAFASMQEVTLPSVGTNWHTVKLSFAGNQIQVFWDGTQVINATDIESQPYFSGGICVDMWTDASRYIMNVDDVTVSAPTTGQSITFDQPTDHIYGDAPFPLNATASSGLAVTYSVLSGPAVWNGTNIVLNAAGLVTVRASQSGDSGYEAATPVDRTFAVNPATLTATADSKTKVYGAAVPSLTYRISGFVNGDTAALVFGSPSLSTPVVATSPPGTYLINTSAGSLTATNYIFTTANGQMAVSKAPLTVAANNAVRGEGQTNPVFTVSYSGFVNGDNASVLSGAPLLTTSATASSLQGTYPISIAAGTLTAANYSFNFVAGVLTVQWMHSLFSDNFSRATDPGPLAPWIIQAGNWTNTAGVLAGGINPLFSYSFIYLTNTWSDYSVQAKVRFDTGGFGGGIGGRLDPASGAHYAAWVYPENSPGGSSLLKLIKFQSWDTFGYQGTPFLPMQQVSLPGVGTNWHTVKMTLEGNLITLFFDGAQMLSVSDTEAQPYSSGGISFDFWTDGAGYQMTGDDLQVFGPLEPQTINFPAIAAHTYGDAPVILSPTASSGLPVTLSVVSGPASLTGNVLTLEGAGTVTVNAAQDGSPDYSPASPVLRTFTVNPAQLTATANNSSRIYGASNPALMGTLTGVVGSDNISASYSTAAGAGTPVGNYGIHPTLSDTDGKLANYTVTLNDGVLAIHPASLLGTANNKVRVYGAANPSFTIAYTGFVNGEDTSIISGTLMTSTSADTNSPVGAYPILASGQTAPNYVINYVNGSLTVMPADLLVQANDKSRAYGETNPVFTASLTGFVNSQDSSALDGALVFNTTARTNSPLGTYAIGVSGVSSTNYSITFSNGTLAVTAYPLTVTTDNESRAYGLANPALTGRLTGIQNGDNITASYSTLADLSSGLGTYEIVPALADPDSKLTNYSVTINNGALTVSPATLSVSADNKSKIYGEAIPVLTGLLNGVVNGDNITVSYSTSAG